VRQILRNPPRLPLVGASILAADFLRLESDIQAALDAGADFIHYDVMDGHLVPNLALGTDMLRAVRRAFPDQCLDVHLMINNPADFVGPFADAGADHLTFHIEACPDDAAALEIRDAIRDRGLTAGMAIDGGTPVARAESLLREFDLILIMSIHAGFSGQKFMPESLDKMRAAKAHLRPGQRLEVDGGVGPQTAAAAVEAGCDTLAAASAIFHAPAGEARAEVIRQIRGGSSPF
jgi:ribulose-phosphate 3-epimerase